MPTGLTYKLMEEGESFEDFCLRCCRAMGVCIVMRDDPEGPPPKEFEPHPWHRDRLKAAEAELQHWQAMTREQQIEYIQTERRGEEILHLERVKKAEAENARLDAMQAEVEAWEVTPLLESLKGLMLRQLEDSRETPEPWNHQWSLAPEDYEAMLQRNVEYHREQWQEELARTNERNNYLREFWNALEAHKAKKETK